jgi:hypothetical protein
MSVVRQFHVVTPSRVFSYVLILHELRTLFAQAYWGCLGRL